MSLELVSNDLIEQDDIEAEDMFSVDLDGYEGPLHLLLDLARKQKVDLLKVSMLELANQYIGFIEEVRRKRIDLAADYLLMAAWLAFMKSRLLLPKPEKAANDEIDGEEMAARLAFRLKRLDAMREAGDQLMELAQLGQDVFVRGAPEKPRVIKQTEYDTTLWHLMQAFGSIRQRREEAAPHRVEHQFVLPLENARDSLKSLSKLIDDWASLDQLRARMTDIAGDIPPRSVTASVFSAALELARDGDVELRQDQHFSPLYLRGAQEERGGLHA
ncbi:segregation and condensation protein A [Henriciella pelagia]|jgi:segregation and condensation protein A|uniref:Segregation and condensation protein A n=1 Tax=Henriciella pelagia TaxID=1977912 RepID=A0ABQ1J956_9PROT|nr:ScpA family protein [Henriciella pelagia]GGB60739.1 segregation/condensation protein A [Henriciella pelagia]